MRLRKKKLNRLNISQKKRESSSTKELILKFGNSGFYFLKENRLELCYLVFFRKLIKKLKFPQYCRLYGCFYKKIWFFLKKNFPITKKSKNSRMGKGKGKFSRWTIRVQKFHMFFEFQGYTTPQLIWVKNKINKKNNLHVAFLQTQNKPFILAAKHKYSSNICSLFKHN